VNFSPKLKINRIVGQLPRKVVTNEDLSQENPAWDMPTIFARTGVHSRHIADNDETALDLAVSASLTLFKEFPDLKHKIDAVIFCTQSQDYILPSNSCLLHRHLEMKDQVLAFDYNLACSGYIYGLAISQGFFSSGLAQNILLVCGDTYSKYIHPQDRSARTVFGDGAAVSWLSGTSGSNGLIDILCSTWGRGYESFIIPAGGCRRPRDKETQRSVQDITGNVRTMENIHMKGSAVLEFVKEKIPAQVSEILNRNRLKISDIELIVCHQASLLTLETLRHLLGARQDQVYSNLATVGNTVSSSIPLALRSAQDEGRVGAGQLVLLIGFGVGLSYGCCLIQM
jgi:3-oxoacyl-[acyl-carrier-protein] synthase-3